MADLAASKALAAALRLTTEQTVWLIEQLRDRLPPPDSPVVGGKRGRDRKRKCQQQEVAIPAAARAEVKPKGRIELRWVNRCGKLYGPYRYLVRSEGGKREVKYIGKPK